MATTIITKNGSGAPLAGDLQVGELAIDLTNKKLYSKEGTTVFEVGATGGGAAGTFTDLTATNSFTSVGIDDNATSTAITIDSSQNVSLSGDLTVDTNTLYVDSTNNRVGINRTPTTFNVEFDGSAQLIHDRAGANTAQVVVGSGGTSNVIIDGDTIQLRDEGGVTQITKDVNGNVGIGESTPVGILHLKSDDTGVVFQSSSGVNNRAQIFFQDSAGTQTAKISVDPDGGSANVMAFSTGTSERMRIDSSGNVLVGTTDTLPGIGDTNAGISMSATNGIIVSRNNDAPINMNRNTSDGILSYFRKDGVIVGGIGTDAGDIYFGSGATATERMRIDSSGNVGIGTTDPQQKMHVDGGGLQIDGNISTPASGQTGVLIDYFSDGARFWSRGTASARGTFSFIQLENDGGNQQTAMFIDTSGNLLVGMTTLSTSDAGVQVRNDGLVRANRSGSQPLILNRTTDDGTLVSLLQDGSTEGTISVSGTTVSYNGGHLSRWSQSDIDDVSAIYKGTVMSNLDEMCEWDNEDNEQLNKTKVSDVEGDVNVAGVFVAKDNSDDLSDYYLAMTGDMIIRIAQGTTVQRGALLMSAGDGTAKPQDDDIVRSKTIAKVTSTNVTCTYADGSYCVPCVLMAC